MYLIAERVEYLCGLRLLTAAASRSHQQLHNDAINIIIKKKKKKKKKQAAITIFISSS